MPDLESLYLKLPILLQNMACSIEGWRIQRGRYTRLFWNLLREAEGRTFWSAEEIQTYRDKRLAVFVKYCAKNVPFYKKLFQQNDLMPDDIQTLDDLKVLPILTKEMVQDHYAEMLSQAVPDKHRIIAHTSGTTGGGLHFATTQEAIQEQWAIWWRYRRWHGIQPGVWCGYFGGRSVVPLSQAHPPFWRYNLQGKQILFSAYHMNSDNLVHYVSELRLKRPAWLHGYPSLLSLLSAYLLENDIDLGYSVRWVTVGAENLMPHQIELIKHAFGVRPRQHYGMAEAVANISECEYGALHVDEEFATVEFIPNSDGPGYKVVGTNFSNFAMPFLRYDVQDIATLSSTTCPCGRPGRVVERIDGRQEDYIILENGAKIGRMDHIFKDMVNIREAQIYQRHPGKVIIRVVRGEKYTQKDEAGLLLETKKRVGNQTNIHFEYVEKLQRSATGKLRFVVSELKEGKIEQLSN